MNLNPKHPIADLVTKTSAKTGFHVEHILSWNEENQELFGGDEELFEQERNRLGGILLLKGKDNISSNNERYTDKLKSYANTLYWNETLRADSYKSKLDMKALKDKFGLELEPLERFGPDQLETRHQLLFKLVGIIWNWFAACNWSGPFSLCPTILHLVSESRRRTTAAIFSDPLKKTTPY